jgi:gluconate 2-dehydrogenase alpha chain
MKTLPHVDVAIIGGGWTGLLMAKEISGRTGLSVVVMERGEPRSTSQYQGTMDELDYAIRLRMMKDLSQETITLRRGPQERALPMRQYGFFHEGTGVGGSGEHWNGTCFRGMPEGFEILSRTIERYGQKRLPADHDIRNWAVSYTDLEPHYARIESMIGVSGKSGNLGGKLTDRGNPFEGPRSAEYPTPPTKVPYVSELFRKSAAGLGYHPYQVPSATISEHYTNPDGVSRSGCAYCGYCERFGCMIGAKAQPTNVLLPVLLKRKSVSLRTGADVRRIVLDGKGASGKARGVLYRDASGQECFQPADLVISASWTMNNTRLLLNSGIGQPYDPTTGKGTLGRNLTHQVNHQVRAFFAQPLNRFMGAGSAGLAISDLEGDSFDHNNLQFLRGGIVMALNTGGKPIAGFGAVPSAVKARWGSEWKKAAVEYYDRTYSVVFLGEQLPYKGHFMDLDPRYKDRYGDPLLRVTLNWGENERKMVEYTTPKVAEIAKGMGATEVNSSPALGEYDGRFYQGTHVHGGTIMGTSREDSVVNPYQQHWDVPNLFVVGPSTFPQNSVSSAPTLTILATTSRVADVVVEKYVKQPGPLA